MPGNSYENFYFVNEIESHFLEKIICSNKRDMDDGMSDENSRRISLC